MGNFATMAEIVQGLLDYGPVIPEANCRCHISPPCNDCVDYGHQRYLQTMAEETIRQLKALDLISE